MTEPTNDLHADPTGDQRSTPYGHDAQLRPDDLGAVVQDSAALGSNCGIPVTVQHLVPGANAADPNIAALLGFTADPPPLRICRVCGCTDDDCTQCLAATGQTCTWVAGDLCSRCAPDTPSGYVATNNVALTFTVGPGDVAPGLITQDKIDAAVHGWATGDQWGRRGYPVAPLETPDLALARARAQTPGARFVRNLGSARSDLGDVADALGTAALLGCSAASYTARAAAAGAQWAAQRAALLVVHPLARLLTGS